MAKKLPLWLFEQKVPGIGLNKGWNASNQYSQVRIYYNFSGIPTTISLRIYTFMQDKDISNWWNIVKKKIETPLLIKLTWA